MKLKEELWTFPSSLLFNFSYVYYVIPISGVFINFYLGGSQAVLGRPQETHWVSRSMQVPEEMVPLGAQGPSWLHY